MNITEAVQTSCTTQQLATGRPNTKWTADELVIYAQDEHRAIFESEQNLTVRNRRLEGAGLAPA
jgi:hypothetical protein